MIDNELEEKYIHDYIENINISQIEWIKLNSSELKDFYDKYYYDKENYRYVGDKKGIYSLPIGLHYLSFYPNKNYDYLLGIVSNNIGKKTILVALTYIDNYYIYSNQIEPITYLCTIEVNEYFRRKGLFKEFCEILPFYINPNQHILATKESEIGSKVMVIEREKDSLYRHDFKKNVFVDDGSAKWDIELRDLVCSNDKVKKKRLFYI